MIIYGFKFPSHELPQAVSIIMSSTGQTDAENHTFLYNRRLNWVNQEIRLLEILPAESNTPLVKLKLRYVSLKDQPEYTALSYAWGGPKVTKSVTINDKEVQVTINLEAALKEIQRYITQDSSSAQAEAAHCEAAGKSLNRE